MILRSVVECARYNSESSYREQRGFSCSGLESKPSPDFRGFVKLDACASIAAVGADSDNRLFFSGKLYFPTAANVPAPTDGHPGAESPSCTKHNHWAL